MYTIFPSSGSSKVQKFAPVLERYHVPCSSEEANHLGFEKMLKLLMDELEKKEIIQEAIDAIDYIMKWAIQFLVASGEKQEKSDRNTICDVVGLLINLEKYQSSIKVVSMIDTILPVFAKHKDEKQDEHPAEKLIDEVFVKL